MEHVVARSAERLRHMAALALVVVLPLAGIGAVPAPHAAPADLEALADAIAVRTYDVGAFAVIRAGRVVLRRDLGTSTATTAYPIGSLSMLFTATAILQLVDAGTLGLDEPIARWFPTFPRGREITVRMLLQHRSGIPDHLRNAMLTGAVRSPITPAEIVADAATQAPDFAPGTSWNLSNTGYLMLGMIIESVSGLPLADYERRRIFDVAGMPHSALGGVMPGTSLASPALITAPGRRIRPIDYAWFFGCGDVFTTIDDLAAFDIALMRGTLLSKSARRRMRAVVARDVRGPGYDAGSGVFVRRTQARTIVGHDSAVRGDEEFIAGTTFSADDEFLADDTTAVVGLAVSSAVAHDLTNPIIDALAPPGAAIPETPADPDPAFTAHALAVMNDLTAGRVDDASWSAPERVLPTTLAARVAEQTGGGACTGLAFQYRVIVARPRRGMTTHYLATFGKRTLPVTFIVGDTGRIATLFFTPLRFYPFTPVP